MFQSKYIWSFFFWSISWPFTYWINRSYNNKVSTIICRYFQLTCSYISTTCCLFLTYCLNSYIMISCCSKWSTNIILVFTISSSKFVFLNFQYFKILTYISHNWHFHSSFRPYIQPRI